MGFTLEFRVYYISPEPYERFSSNPPKCLRVQNPWLSYMDSWSSSHFIFLDFFTLQSSVWSISPKPWIIYFLNFTQSLPSVRLYAVPITQLGPIKVKVTLQGIGISLRFRVHSFSPKSFARISLKFAQIFLLVRPCAGSITRLRPLNVKVTLLGH